MKAKISYIDQNHFLYQAVNILFSAVNLGILTWAVYGTHFLLEPASSGQSMNCSFSHFRVGFTRAGGCRLDLTRSSYIKQHQNCVKLWNKMLTNEEVIMTVKLWDADRLSF